MDEKFQDRIDNYLLNRMDDAEKAEFLREVEQDKEKKEQLEFTQNVKDSIRSREEKLQAWAQFQQQYEEEHKAIAMRATGIDAVYCCSAPKMEEKTVHSKKNKWLWISSVAAILVIGFFAVKPMLVYDSSSNYDNKSIEQIRGGDEVFSPIFTDSAYNDTITSTIGEDATIGK